MNMQDTNIAINYGMLALNLFIVYVSCFLFVVDIACGSISNANINFNEAKDLICCC